MSDRTQSLLLLREQYRRDFVRYASEQLYIQTKRAGQIVTLDVMSKPLQRMVVSAVSSQLRELGYVDGNIVKGRQQGSSTVTQALQFWKASLTSNYNTLLIAQDKPTAKSIFEKARFFYEHLHPAIKPLIRASNRDELVFAAPTRKERDISDHGLGSRMDFLNSENMMAGTGTTRQGLHISEGAKYRDDDIEILLASLYPCVLHGEGTIRIKESTPFVGGQWFRECCDAAREGKVEEFFVFCPWYLEPDYVRKLTRHDKDLKRMKGLDAEERRIVKIAKKGQKKDGVPPFEITPEQLKWRRWIVGQPGFDENIFLQEYPTDYDSAWISFDNRAFNHQKLYEIRDRDLKPPKRLVRIEPGPVVIDDLNARFDAESNYIAIWREPEANEEYDIGADIAAGIEGGDWSTAEIVKRRTREQVGEIHVHRDPSDFGILLHWAGIWYNRAQIACETTGGYGVATEGQLKRMNYSNMYMWRHRDQAIALPTKKTGWQTTPESKAYLIAGIFRTFVNKDQVCIRSKVLLDEMFNYIQIPYGDSWTYRASEGHDDLVMGFGITLVIGDDESMAGLEEGERRVLAPQTPEERATAIAEASLDLAARDAFNPRYAHSSNFARELGGGG